MVSKIVASGSPESLAYSLLIIEITALFEVILDKFFSEISLGSLPLNPGIETISLSLFSPGQADPNFTFNNSACFSIIEQPSLISSVMSLPPKGITAV